MINIEYGFDPKVEIESIKKSVSKLHGVLEDVGEMTSDMWCHFVDVEDDLDAIAQLILSMVDGYYA